MTSSKYGRLFTERDVERLIAEALIRQHTQPVVSKLAAVLAHIDPSELTFPADEPLFLLRGQGKTVGGLSDRQRRELVCPVAGDARRPAPLPHCRSERREPDVSESYSELDVRLIERMHMRVADRLLAARGSVYEAFRRTGSGLNPDALAEWWEQSPAAQSMGDQSGKEFGCALIVAMMAVEAERDTRRLGRWFR